MFLFLPGESPTSPFHTWANILGVVPKVVQAVWDSGGMVSAGSGRLQSPGWDPKARGPHKPERHHVGRPDSMLTDSSWYVTQSQRERGKKGISEVFSS